jgi:hypothetical protein
VPPWLVEVFRVIVEVAAPALLQGECPPSYR